MTAVVDPEKCTACGECVLACPLGTIVLKDENGTATIDCDTCGECGVCIDICPAVAIML